MAETNDVYQMTFEYLQEGQVLQNVTHWAVTSKTGGGTSNGEIAVGLDTVIKPTLVARMAATCTYAMLRGVRVYPTRSDPFFLPVTGGAGTGGIEGMPTFVAVCYTIYTGVASKHTRGRHYWPGVPEGATIAAAPSTLTAAQLVLENAHRDNLLLPFVAGTSPNQNVLRLCVYARPGITPAPAPPFTIATAIAVRPNLTTFRSRKLGRGI